MNPLDQFRKTYFEECAELLEALQTQLDRLVTAADDEETLNAIFRCVHSIKGGAGAFGFTALVGFSHVFESLLDAMRDRKVVANPEVVKILLRAADALADIVSAVRDEHPLPDGFAADIAAALEDLLLGPDVAAPAKAAPATIANGARPLETEQRYRICFTPHTEMLRKANEPLLLIRQLQQLGGLTVDVDTARLPTLDAIEPEAAYLNWTFILDTGVPQSAIHEIFEFVEDDCDLTIQPLPSAPVITGAPTDSQPPGNPSRATAAAGTKVGDPVTALVVQTQSIRVDVDKVDRLVNLVGETVITQAMLTEQSKLLPVDQYPALLHGIETLAQHARELQESVMAIRAQPVKSVFARMPRVVRDLAAVLGKEVRIVTSGETTEIDKTVIEQLNDPLTHMIRNALDHGIEAPDVRIAAGKPRQGTIHLSAAQRGGRIIIEVADDGRGIDREKLLAKGRERGLLPVGITPSEAEIDNLIFQPAFSTADKITSISGRGVGMDVVKRNVQALSGRIAVHSRFGTGSRFTLSLPLTLAVVDGMVVSVGKETFIIPLTAIIESLRPRPADIHRVVSRGDVLSLRGEYVPLIHLNKRFAIADAILDACKGIVIIVQSETAGRLGVVVDELLGQQQVVVKSLETNYAPVEGISGATILGNGRVALILDIARLRDADGQTCGRQTPDSGGWRENTAQARVS